jgi:hypothetical protein
MPAKIVTVPGMGDVPFPDTMSDDEIAAVISQQQGGSAPSAATAPPATTPLRQPSEEYGSTGFEAYGAALQDPQARQQQTETLKGAAPGVIGSAVGGVGGPWLGAAAYLSSKGLLSPEQVAQHPVSTAIETASFPAISAGVNKLMTMLPKAMTAAEAMGLIRKGVLPKDPDFMPTLGKNVDVLKTAPPIASKAQLADFLEQSGTAHRGIYENLLKPNEMATVGTRQIKGYLGETLGGEAEAATLRQLDSRLNVINNTIRDAKAGVGGAPLSTEGIAPLKAEANAIRKVLYPEIQRLSGVDPAPIHAKMGQLNDLARQVRASEIARFNQVNRPIDAPTTTKAGLAARAVGAVQRKLLGDPQDLAIRRALEGLRAP